MTIRRLVAATASTALLAACATPGPAGAPEPDVANAPVYDVGDGWVLRASDDVIETRVIAVAPEGPVTELLHDVECPGCRYHRDRHLTILRARDAQRRATRAVPAHMGLRRLDFPLFVGKTWEQQLTLPSQQGEPVDFQMRFRVEAREPVVVPAGTFAAFVTWTWEDRARQTSGSTTYWYAPAVRWFVRVSGYGKGGAPELESYRLGVRR